MRCFISIDIPNEIKNKIKLIQKFLPEFEGKITEIENLHLTLKFLGEVDKNKLEKVKKKLSKIKTKKFSVQIDSIGFFSPKVIRIIWLHVNDCTNLQKQIDNSLLKIFPKERRFMSHLTIARVKFVKDKKEFLNKLKLIKIPAINFEVDSFNLKESILSEKKPFYKNIESYELI